jgi:hypothetical protein
MLVLIDTWCESFRVQNKRPIWLRHHSSVTSSGMLSHNLFKVCTHAPHNIAPQILWIILLCDGSPGISQDEIGTGRARVPDSLLHFTFQLSRNPCRVSLDEKGLGGIKTIYPHFVHEFFGTSNKDSGCQLFASVDLTESVQDGKLFRQNRAAVGDGS